MTSQLIGSDFSNGALLPNYVNGRLLVAEDLATAQDSLRLRDTRIGEAAGAGIVRGLWVAGLGTKLKVDPGLALAHSGSPVLVANTVVLELSFAIAGPATNASAFACCTSTSGGESSALTDGIYVLTARPACKLEGSSPLAPAPGQTLSPCCAAEWQVEGVEFRVIALPISETVDSIDITPDNRRNLVAHWCFGTEKLVTLGADPFSFDPAYGGLDSLDTADLTAYDVPLAVFGWDGSTVSDLDNWSVRRRVTETDPGPSSWAVTTCDRREADGQARFRQFQDQIDGLVSASQAVSATAQDHFGLLPPVGFLPVHNSDLKRIATDAITAMPDTFEVTTPAAGTSTPSTNPRLEEMILAAEKVLEYRNLLDVANTTVGYGFDPVKFFGGLGRYGGMLHWQVAEWALQQSWRMEPVSTDVVEIYKDLVMPRIAMERTDLTYAGTETTTTGTTNTPATDAAPPTPQSRLNNTRTAITYYYVVENLDAASNNLVQRRQSVLDFASFDYQMGFVRSRLYVVFIANQLWVTGSLPPVVEENDRRVWSGTGQ